MENKSGAGACGLWRALAAQSRTRAREIERQFNAAWKCSDRTLTLDDR
jgi:hypothetical protein